MHIIDPLTDRRWRSLVECHPSACAFHSEGWLRALAETYGYEPFVVTACEPAAELTNALPFCRIKSWITGERVVSLPFSDHCQPLVNTEAELRTLVDFSLQSLLPGPKFIELRPANSGFAPLDKSHESATYCMHWLDLTTPLETIFGGLHKDSIQRKIRRAEREGLVYEKGRSPEMLERFYSLLIRTRRRHGVPPQPIAWFRNLLRFMEEAMEIRLAWKGEIPVASIVTLKHSNSMIYKYGCSDERYHATGGMPFVFWRLIEEAKSASIPILDFGRSDLDNAGLIRFKDQWGTRRTELKYYRLPAPDGTETKSRNLSRVAEVVFARLPDPLLRTISGMLYRHIG